MNISSFARTNQSLHYMFRNQVKEMYEESAWGRVEFVGDIEGNDEVRNLIQSRLKDECIQFLFILYYLY